MGLNQLLTARCVVPDAAGVPEHRHSNLLFAGSSYVSLKLQEAKPNKDCIA